MKLENGPGGSRRNRRRRRQMLRGGLAGIETTEGLPAFRGNGGKRILPSTAQHFAHVLPCKNRQERSDRAGHPLIGVIEGFVEGLDQERPRSSLDGGESRPANPGIRVFDRRQNPGNQAAIAGRDSRFAGRHPHVGVTMAQTARQEPPHLAGRLGTFCEDGKQMKPVPAISRSGKILPSGRAKAVVSVLFRQGFFDDAFLLRVGWICPESQGCLGRENGKAAILLAKGKLIQHRQKIMAPMRKDPEDGLTAYFGVRVRQSRNQVVNHACSGGAGLLLAAISGI